MFANYLVLFLIPFLLSACLDSDTSKTQVTDRTTKSEYILHQDISTTVFWVGESANGTNGGIANIASAWDENWMTHFGGLDDPLNRTDYKPTLFSPKENPFYFALPFNDFDFNGDRKKDLERYIPWAKYFDLNASLSICKNRWIKIIKGDKVAYAQWQDVGPFQEDDQKYVFGDAMPQSSVNNSAGLDVSPSVSDYLGLNGLEKTSWQFVDFIDVPVGPWLDTITTSNIETSWYTPPYNTSWQWQLKGALNTTYDVALYDVDLFDTSIGEIQALHNANKKVICYFSAGSYEDWRDDASSFSSALKGKKMDGWDELWLDISNDSLRVIMQNRLSLAKSKACDGVEADNVDGYVNDTGFTLSQQQQLDYNIFLANEAHKLSLSIALKNDLLQIDTLVKYFDFSVNEQCHEYNECDRLNPFIKANKPVFNAEYLNTYQNNTSGARDTLCKQSKKENFQTLILPLDLDDTLRFSCQP